MRDNKVERWRNIRQFLDDNPGKAQNEIEKAIFDRLDLYTPRTIRRDLDDMVKLDILDNVSGLFWIGGTKKRKFDSTNDYRLAINHSKSIIKDLFDYMYPHGPHEHPLPGYVFYWVTNPPTGIDSCPAINKLRAHLRTGYFNEVWLPTEKFNTLLQKYQLHQDNVAPYHPVLELFKQYGQAIGVESALDKLPKSDRELIQQLKVSVIGHLYTIIEGTYDGIPFNGKCETCPGNKITIADKQPMPTIKGARG